MKRLRFLLALAITLAMVGGFAPHAARAGVQDFTIDSFEADYHLSRDKRGVSQLAVEEVIVANFPQSDQNHGILRALPNGYLNYKKAPTIHKVTDQNGHEIRFETTISNDNTVLKIGNADEYVHGRQTYRISYSQPYVINTNLEGQDEFYWDINGDQWQQPFTKVTARIHIPAELRSALQSQHQCFTGIRGSASQDCSFAVQQGSDETIIVVGTSRPLLSAETLTTVLGFTKGTFVGYHQSTFEKLRPFILFGTLGLVPPLVAGIFTYRRWKRDGRDPKGRGTIVPEYLPPKEISVLAAAMIMSEKIEPKAVTAQMLDLAVRGYMKIYEIKEVKRFRPDTKTYEIELEKATDKLRPEEQRIAALLFGEGATPGARVDINKVKATLSPEVAKIDKELAAQAAAAGYFRADPRKAMTPYFIASAILLAIGLFGLPFSAGFIPAAIIVAIAAKYMPARTASGVELREALLGLEMYMKVAESERIKMMQSPSGRYTEKIDVSDKAQLIKLYEKLLPYAILFAIEQEWAAQFAELYKDQSPGWYVGSTPLHGVAFANAFAGFATTANQNFSPPSSSSGSGFGGGGSAGGGGGGGGGGGW